MGDAFADLLAMPVAAAGWYGKMPALGDFASRRLPERFIGAWDRWLSAGIDVSRAQMGEAWLDCFLRAPVWRFGLLPGVVDEAAWFGVMMPSVDRVGRYYPLTIAAPVALPCNLEGTEALQHWLRCLHEIALAALADAHTLDQLEASLEELARTSGLQALAPATWVQNEIWPIDDDELVDALPAAALPRLWQQCRGQSLWWCASSREVQRYPALPPPEGFRRMLAVPVPLAVQPAECSR